MLFAGPDALRVVDVLTDRVLMGEWVRTALIHMDDTNVELQVPST